MILQPTGTILSRAGLHLVNLAAPVAACPTHPQPQETAMFATIQAGPHSSAQGPRVTQHADGRVTISTGRGTLTGFPVGSLAPMGV